MQILTHGLFINVFIDLFFEGYLEFVINCWVNMGFPPTKDDPSGEQVSLLMSNFFGLVIIAVPLFSGFILYKGPKFTA